MINRLAAHRRHGIPDEDPGAGPGYMAIVAVLRRIPAAQRRALAPPMSCVDVRRLPARLASLWADCLDARVIG
jgi:hypothetical protein